MGEIEKYRKLVLNWYAHRKTLVDLTVASIGLILFPWHLLLYSYIFFFFVIIGIFLTVFHDFLSHEYVRPKNKFLETLFLLFFVAYSWTSLRYKKNYHYLHHKYTDTDKDPTKIKIQSTSKLGYILDLGPKIELNLSAEEFPMITGKSWELIDKYYHVIAISFVIVWLAFLPLWTFFTFYVYPIVMTDIVARWVDNRYHRQDYNKIKDSPWLLFIVGSQGWHKKHHHKWDKIDFGEGQWIYANPQYWCTKLFFKPFKIKNKLDKQPKNSVLYNDPLSYMDAYEQTNYLENSYKKDYQ